MLEMIMLLGTGLAAAGIAGMTGIGSQSGDEDIMEPASAATNEYHLGDDYEGGEGEDLLSQVRRMGEALDLGKLIPGAADGEANTAEEAESLAAEPVADSAQAEKDELVDFDALLTSLDYAGETADIDADPAVEEDMGAEEICLFADEDGADEDAAEADTEEAEAAETEVEETAEAEAFEEDFEDEDEIPVITDFAAGSEQLLLMLPDGMDDDTSVNVLPAGKDGMDAEVVLTDGQGSVTAVIVAGAYGSLSAGDVVLEREG